MTLGIASLKLDIQSTSSTIWPLGIGLRFFVMIHQAIFCVSQMFIGRWLPKYPANNSQLYLYGDGITQGAGLMHSVRSMPMA